MAGCEHGAATDTQQAVRLTPRVKTESDMKSLPSAATDHGKTAPSTPAKIKKETLAKKSPKTRVFTVTFANDQLLLGLKGAKNKNSYPRIASIKDGTEAGDQLKVFDLLLRVASVSTRGLNADAVAALIKQHPRPLEVMFERRKRRPKRTPEELAALRAEREQKAAAKIAEKEKKAAKKAALRAERERKAAANAAEKKRRAVERAARREEKQRRAAEKAAMRQAQLLHRAKVKREKAEEAATRRARWLERKRLLEAKRAEAEIEKERLRIVRTSVADIISVLEAMNQMVSDVCSGRSHIRRSKKGVSEEDMVRLERFALRRHPALFVGGEGPARACVSGTAHAVGTLWRIATPAQRHQLSQPLPGEQLFLSSWRCSAAPFGFGNVTGTGAANFAWCALPWQQRSAWAQRELAMQQLVPFFQQRRKSGKKRKHSKSQSKAKQPLGPFFVFKKKMGVEIADELKLLKWTDRAKRLGELWRGLSEQEKQAYYTPKYKAWVKRQGASRAPRPPFFQFMSQERKRLGDEWSQRTASDINSELLRRWRALDPKVKSSYATDEWKVWQGAKSKGQSTAIAAVERAQPRLLMTLGNDRLRVFELDQPEDIGLAALWTKWSKLSPVTRRQRFPLPVDDPGCGDQWNPESFKKQAELESQAMTVPKVYRQWRKTFVPKPSHPRCSFSGLERDPRIPPPRTPSSHPSAVAARAPLMPPIFHRIVTRTAQHQRSGSLPLCFDPVCHMFMVAAQDISTSVVAGDVLYSVGGTVIFDVPTLAAVKELIRFKTLESTTDLVWLRRDVDEKNDEEHAVLRLADVASRSQQVAPASACRRSAGWVDARTSHMLLQAIDISVEDVSNEAELNLLIGEQPCFKGYSAAMLIDRWRELRRRQLSSSSPSGSGNFEPGQDFHFYKTRLEKFEDIDDVLLLESSGIGNTASKELACRIMLTRNRDAFAVGATIPLQGDVLIGVDDDCIVGCHLGSVMRIIQNRDQGCVLTFRRGPLNGSSTDSQAMVLHHVATDSMVDSVRVLPSLYNGVTWMDIPGTCQWCASLDIALGSDVSSAAGKDSAPTVSIIGFFELEIQAAQVFDAAARMQWGNRSAPLLNFAARSRTEYLKMVQAAQQTYSWAQCDDCSKWRVLEEPWKRQAFTCRDATRSCRDAEDTQERAAEILKQNRIQGNDLLYKNARDWLLRVESAATSDKDPVAAVNTIDKLLLEADEFPPYFPDALAALRSEREIYVSMVDAMLERVKLLAAAAQSFDSSLEQVKCGIRIDLTQDFELPADEFPVYGRRMGILVAENKFRCQPMGALVQRGYIRLDDDEAERLQQSSLETTEETSRWLRGIFLAEDCLKDQFVFRYDGAKRRKTQVHVQGDNLSDIYKYRTHTMQSGAYLYDASDTDRYPNGLVNTQPTSSSLHPYTTSWGKATQPRQKGAPTVSNRNLFLSANYPAGTLLTVNFGSSYNTSGFSRLVCVPNHLRSDHGSAFGAGLRHGVEAVGRDVQVFWPMDNQWYTAKIGDCNHLGQHHIQYEDGTSEWRHLHKTEFKWRGKASGTSQSSTGASDVSGKRKQSRADRAARKKRRLDNSAMFRSVAAAKKCLSPVLEKLVGMSWDLPYGNAMLQTRTNPFFYSVTKGKSGIDGLQRKPRDMPDSVVAAINGVQHRSRKSPFLKLPAYFSVVHKPMSLQIMQRKLRLGKYASASEFSADVKLIADNACKYYGGREHAFSIAAGELMGRCKNLLAKD